MASGVVTVSLRDVERIQLYVTGKKEPLTASQV